MAPIDPRDPMLPLMIWYGIEPLAGADPARAAALAGGCKTPSAPQLHGPSRRDRRRGHELDGTLPELAKALR